MNLLSHQIPPQGDWRTWVIIGDHGTGKTTAAAAWVHALAMSGSVRDLLLLGPDFYTVRDTMAHGHSGVQAVAPAHERPAYSHSGGVLLWTNGARAFLLSAEEPDRLAGVRGDAAWAEELPRWCLSLAWAALQSALRHGGRAVVTANPRVGVEDDGRREEVDAVMTVLVRQPGTVTTESAGRSPHVV